MRAFTKKSKIPLTDEIDNHLVVDCTVDKYRPIRITVLSLILAGMIFLALWLSNA